MLGDEIFIQRGETFSLDFEIKDANGRPFCIPNKWNNAYLMITISAALYKQRGDFRRTYWLDLSSLKKFTGTEALYMPRYAPDIPFAISQVMNKYGNIITLNEDTDSDDNDITNYLFCTDPNNDGKLVYKYVEDYTLENGEVTEERWTEYNCRFVQPFYTKDWVEQRYLYDANIVNGPTVLEYLNGVLARDGMGEFALDTNADDETIRNTIALLRDGPEKEYIRKVYESGRPLMPEYDAKFCLWLPKKIFVSVDLQGEI